MSSMRKEVQSVDRWQETIPRDGVHNDGDFAAHSATNNPLGRQCTFTPVSERTYRLKHSVGVGYFACAG